jgi:hypothetical protein
LKWRNGSFIGLSLTVEARKSRASCLQSGAILARAVLFNRRVFALAWTLITERVRRAENSAKQMRASSGPRIDARALTIVSFLAHGQGPRRPPFWPDRPVSVSPALTTPLPAAPRSRFVCYIRPQAMANHCSDRRVFSRRIAWLLTLAGLAGCSCSPLRGEVDSFAFTRCAERDPPAERKLKLGQVELAIEGRAVAFKGPEEIRVAAFTGPVGAAFSRADLASLAASRAQVFLFLGGLGDSPETASANLVALAALRVPTFFVPGGADRLDVVDSAFEQLDEETAGFIVHGSGVRELRINKERFAVLPGAAQGRYAVDDESCGFEQADLDALEDALDDGPSGRTWLLAWNAPAGWGVSAGAGGEDVGSRELSKLAESIAAHGGLFAYPEVQVLTRGREPKHGGLALVVPRLSRTGSQRADGGRIPRAVASLMVTAQGLLTAP